MKVSVSAEELCVFLWIFSEENSAEVVRRETRNALWFSFRAFVTFLTVLGSEGYWFG